MKQSSFLLSAAFCILLASCSKEAGLIPGTDPSLEPATMYSVTGSVIMLHPDNDGDNDGDTDDLLAAIASAGDGGCVFLTTGVYSIGVVEIYGFNGRICGAGQGKTIIKPKALIEVLPLENEKNIIPCLWRIVGGDVTISDMTFEVGNESFLVDTDPFYVKSLATLMSVNNYSEDFEKDDPRPMNFTIRNVTINGGKIKEEDSYQGTGFNIIMTLWIGTQYYWPPAENFELTKGNYRIINCKFTNCYDGPEFFSFGDQACGIIDRMSSDGCLYGIYCTANYGGRISITNSIFRNSIFCDVFLEDNDWGLLSGINPVKNTEYNISGNTFYSGSSANSLVIQDTWGVSNPTKYKPALAVIKNNHFILREEAKGISLLNNINGQVRNNRFTGTGTIGVIVDGVEVANPFTFETLGTGVSKFAMIMGNNFTGLKPTDSHIYLGKASSFCTVIGNGKENVINEGENNRIVGMKPIKGGMHLGPSLYENLWKLHRLHNK